MFCGVTQLGPNYNVVETCLLGQGSYRREMQPLRLGKPAQVLFPLYETSKLQSHIPAKYKHDSSLGRSPSLTDECKAIFGTEPVWRLRAARRKNVSVCTKESNGNFTECALMQRRTRNSKCCAQLKCHAKRRVWLGISTDVSYLQCMSFLQSDQRVQCRH